MGTITAFIGIAIGALVTFRVTNTMEWFAENTYGEYAGSNTIQNLVCATETGTGYTLASLLPIVLVAVIIISIIAFAIAAGVGENK